MGRKNRNKNANKSAPKEADEGVPQNTTEENGDNSNESTTTTTSTTSSGTTNTTSTTATSASKSADSGDKSKPTDVEKEGKKKIKAIPLTPRKKGKNGSTSTAVAKRELDEKEREKALAEVREERRSARQKHKMRRSSCCPNEEVDGAKSDTATEPSSATTQANASAVKIDAQAPSATSSSAADTTASATATTTTPTTSSSTEEPMECGICMENITIRGKIECCDHAFCFACIMHWSRVTNTCPMCKARFKRVEKKHISGPPVSLGKTIHKIKTKDQRPEYSPPRPGDFDSDSDFDGDITVTLDSRDLPYLMGMMAAEDYEDFSDGDDMIQVIDLDDGGQVFSFDPSNDEALSVIHIFDDLSDYDDYGYDTDSEESDDSDDSDSDAESEGSSDDSDSDASDAGVWVVREREPRRRRQPSKLFSSQPQQPQQSTPHEDQPTTTPTTSTPTTEDQTTPRIRQHPNSSGAPRQNNKSKRPRKS